MSASQQASHHHHRPVNEGYLTIKIQFVPGNRGIVRSSTVVEPIVRLVLMDAFFFIPLPPVFQGGIEFRQAPTGAIVYCSPTLSGPYYRTSPLPPGLEGRSPTRIAPAVDQR
ncbi:hypothetical protein ABZX51_007789 [Aspergillus tubingensis]